MNTVEKIIRERPSMTSNFRVGKGVQNDPPKSDIIGLKLSDMVGRGGGGSFM